MSSNTLRTTILPRDAMLARCMLSPCDTSCVRPYVCHTPALYQNAKRRITQTTPYDSPGTLAFSRQRLQLNSDGVTPNGNAN